MSVTTEAPRLVLVQFAKGTTTYHDGLNRSYAAGESASFPPELAMLIVASGNAVRAHRANHPLVQAARTYPDQEAQRLAEAIRSLVPELDKLEAMAVGVGKDLTRIKVHDEQIIQRNRETRLPEDIMAGVSDPERQVKMDDALAVIERKIDALLRRESELFEDLKAKVTAGFERQADTIIKDLAPVLASVVGLITKARDQFAILSGQKAQLDAVKTAAMLAGLDVAVIDQRLTKATGVTALPDTLGALFPQKEARQEERRIPLTPFGQHVIKVEEKVEYDRLGRRLAPGEKKN